MSPCRAQHRITSGGILADLSMNLYLSAFRKPFLVRLGIFHPPRLKSESFARCRQWWQKPFTFSGRVSRFDEDLWLLRWFGWWPFHRLGSIISWHDGFIWKKKNSCLPGMNESFFGRCCCSCSPNNENKTLIKKVLMTWLEIMREISTEMNILRVVLSLRYAILQQVWKQLRFNSTCDHRLCLKNMLKDNK